MALASIGGKDLEGRRMSSRIEPGASSQPVFDCPRLLFSKGAQWVDEIGVGSQQRSVTNSKACKVDRVRGG